MIVADLFKRIAWFCGQCGRWLGDDRRDVREYGPMCSDCYATNRTWGPTPQETERQGDAG